MSPRWPVRPAAVALDLLEARERPVAERLLVEDPLFRAEVDLLRGTARELGELELGDWRPVPPPPRDDDRAVTRRPPSGARRRRSRAGRRAAWTAAPAVAAATIAVVLLAGGGGDPPPRAATTITLNALGGVPGEARLVLAGEEAQLRGRGMPPSGAHDFYEAWLADARGRMVSMGTFRVGRDGRVDVRMAVGVDVRRYRIVDVSLEPDDGNPAHSTRSVMRARI